MEDYVIAFLKEIGSDTSFWGIFKFLLISVFSFFSGLILEMFLSELFDKYRSPIVLGVTFFFFVIFLALAGWSGFRLLSNPLQEVWISALVYIGLFIVLGFWEGRVLKRTT